MDSRMHSVLAISSATAALQIAQDLLAQLPKPVLQGQGAAREKALYESEQKTAAELGNVVQHLTRLTTAIYGAMSGTVFDHRSTMAPKVPRAVIAEALKPWFVKYSVPDSIGDMVIASVTDALYPEAAELGDD